MKKLIPVICIIAAFAGEFTAVKVPYILGPILLNTVTDASCRAEFACNGSTTTFDFTFPIIATSDMKVYHRVNSTGVQTLLTETTHYSLSATNNDYSSGGTITTVSTYASGISLIAIRDIPDSQNATLQDSGVLRLASIEDALDKLTMLHEQQQEEIDRCLKYPPSDASSLSAEVPNSVDRASTTFIFDASSEPSVE
jgi:hypothetical protein